MPSPKQGASAIICLITFEALFGFNAQKERLPDVPDAIHAPPGETVVLVAHASGSQIYTCQAGADSKFIWTLKAPEAELRNAEGEVIGNHFAGPTWKMNDGSEVTGKAVARTDAPPIPALFPGCW